MPKHITPAEHKKMAQECRKDGDMKGYQEHMKEAKGGKKK